MRALILITVSLVGGWKAGGPGVRMEDAAPLPEGCVVFSEFGYRDVAFGPVQCHGQFTGEIRAVAGGHDYRLVAGRVWHFHAVSRLEDDWAVIWIRTELTDGTHAIVELSITPDRAALGPIEVRQTQKPKIRLLAEHEVRFEDFGE